MTVKNENKIKVRLPGGSKKIDRPVTLFEEIKTGRHEALEELRLQKAAFESSLAAGSIADNSGAITHVNSAFLKLWGYTKADDAIGNSVADFFVDQQDAALVLETLNSTGKWEGEFQARKKDGSELIAHGFASTLHNEKGQQIGYQSTNLDVTGQKNVQAALRESEEKYRNMIDNSLVGVTKVTFGGNIVFANQAMLNLLEYNGDDYTQCNIKEFYANPDDRDIFAQTVQEKGEIKNFETELVSYKGNALSVLIHARLEGTILSEIIMDITERKRFDESQKASEQQLQMLNHELKSKNIELEQRVEQSTVQLAAANQELEAFSYSVSHDLRAPLRAISGFSKKLAEKYIDILDDEGKRLLNVIGDNTKRMNQLIEDLLQLSRLGRKELIKNEVDMGQLVREVKDELTAQNAGRQISFKIDELPKSFADRSLMQQVLINLISNAVKFTRQNNKAAIQIGGSSNKKENKYFIKDNGVGFDMKQNGKLFGVFQRLHSAKEFEGTGVGLALVKRIIQRHGGKIWAEAEVNKGATFYFVIPRVLQNSCCCHSERSEES